MALTRQDGKVIWRRVGADGSYAVANDPRLLFGLGLSGDVKSLRVHWPSGRVEEWTDLVLERYHTLRESHGHEVAEGSIP